uniref:Uncharacterized protein n=1 Tax=viral metagenome TaxID=1070528 RepID=A0A6C0LT46_9ZZZZ
MILLLPTEIIFSNPPAIINDYILYIFYILLSLYILLWKIIKKY